MVVASGVACSLGRQVTTVTVREGGTCGVLGTTGPQTTLEPFIYGGMVGVSPWSDQDRANLSLAKDQQEGKESLW